MCCTSADSLGRKIRHAAWLRPGARCSCAGILTVVRNAGASRWKSSSSRFHHLVHANAPQCRIRTARTTGSRTNSTTETPERPLAKLVVRKIQNVLVDTIITLAGFATGLECRGREIMTAVAGNSLMNVVAFCVSDCAAMASARVRSSSYTGSF